MKKNSCLPRLFAGCFPFACRKKLVTNIYPLTTKEPVTSMPPLTTKEPVTDASHKLVYIKWDGNIVIIKKCIEKIVDTNNKEKICEEKAEISSDSLFKKKVAVIGNSIEIKEINDSQKFRGIKKLLQKFIPSEFITLTMSGYDNRNRILKFHLTPSSLQFSNNKIKITSDFFEKFLLRFAEKLTDFFGKVTNSIEVYFYLKDNKIEAVLIENPKDIKKIPKEQRGKYNKLVFSNKDFQTIVKHSYSGVNLVNDKKEGKSESENTVPKNSLFSCVNEKDRLEKSDSASSDPTTSTSKNSELEGSTISSTTSYVYI